MEQIRGIKVNGVRYGANASGIETHMLSPNGTDFLLKISDSGDVYGYNANVPVTPNEPSDDPIESVSESNITLKDSNMGDNAREYDLTVNDGELMVKEKKGELKTFSASTYGNSTSTQNLALCINEVYANDNEEYIANAEHNINIPVSHNFVEISNLNPEKTYDLSNVSLQYYNPLEKNNANKGWHILHLKGFIKPGSTFLIRGAKVANSYAPSTIINVDTFDMEWYEDGKLMAFNNTNGTLYLSHDQVIFPETEYVTGKKYASALGSVAAPADVDSNPSSLLNFKSGTETINVAPGTYLDLIGWGNSFREGGSSVSVTNNENVLLVRRNMLDRSKQALATALDARTNAIKKFWEFVDLSKSDMGNEKSFKPCASFENKNIYTTRSDMRESRPYCVTVTFGIDPTTTRCFNWVSPGIDDEFIFYRKKGETEWSIKESYKKGDGKDANIRTKVMQFANGDNYTMNLPFYDRIYWETSGGRFVTSHKVILKDLESDLKYYTDNTLTVESGSETEFTKGKVYEYCVGRAQYDRYKTPIAPDTEHCSGIYEFQVRKATNKTWRFIQHSDEQGFNDCEYQVWRRTANVIRAQFNPQFTIDTGDMTQNGNRLSEWLDYNTGVESLAQGLPMSFKLTDPSDNTVKTFANESAGVEQMNVVGNNDLCPIRDWVLGNGNDATKMTDLDGKVSTRQFKYFYCYELDVDNLPANLGEQNEYSKVVGHETEYEMEVKTWIPSCYSFNYNNCHFTAICSEITPSSAKNEFGEMTEGGGDAAKIVTFNHTYDVIENWVQKDLNKWYALSLDPEATATYPWAVCYMHEMPWTILTSDYAKAPSANRTGGCKLNDFGSEAYHMSEIFQNNRVRLVIGGHKHTHSHSWPIGENVRYNVNPSGAADWKYSWELTNEQLNDETIRATRQTNSSKTVVYLPNELDEATKTNYADFYKGRKAKTGNVNFPERFALNAKIYQVTDAKETWLPIYIMSQASANKVKSNKEMPADSIPFLHYYYPQTEGENPKVSGDQSFPHFVEYEFAQNEDGSPKELNIRHYKINKSGFCDGQPYSTVYGANESTDRLATPANMKVNNHTTDKLGNVKLTLNWISREDSRTLNATELV